MALSINLPMPSEFGSWQDWAMYVHKELTNVLAQVPDQPVGHIVSYIGGLPLGVLPCDGSSFDQRTYPALFQQLGGGVLPTIPPVGSFKYGIKAQ